MLRLCVRKKDSPFYQRSLLCSADKLSTSTYNLARAKGIEIDAYGGENRIKIRGNRDPERERRQAIYGTGLRRRSATEKLAEQSQKTDSTKQETRPRTISLDHLSREEQDKILAMLDELED